MRNRFLCLCLALVMALPLVLGSCSKGTVIPVEAAPVYTLYCITDESTTKEGIVQVEYELNRTLFYRIGSIVKLELVTADEYHELVESKKLEVSDYSQGTNLTGKNDKREKKALVNTAKLSKSAKKAGYSVMSGEAILSDLEDGIEIQLECPRLDLFLITDYQEYLKMAENGDLAALDTVLSNEAKAIKSYVHSSFFNAAKVNNKTYGVPCNTSIGEYTYIVFNKEVLDESGVALETLKGLEDLSDYLALVKEQNPAVVPLANTVTPWQFSYMFVDGFAAYVNAEDSAANVRSTYEDQAMKEYFAMLSRYNSLGYFVNQDGKGGDSEDITFGVKFISCSQEEMEALAEANNYVYNLYSAPIATSENSIDCLYAVSSLCPSSWLTDVMEILTELYVDTNLQNTFLYGVENQHYKVEDGQAEYKVIGDNEEGSEDIAVNSKYKMNYAHTGNCFIAYTLVGDSKNKWAQMRDQNIAAIESKTIGFMFLPEEFVFGTSKNELGQEVEWAIAEPDYQAIMWNVIQPYYKKLVDGTAFEFDYSAKYAEAEQRAKDAIFAELESLYIGRLEASETAAVRDTVLEESGAAFEEQALTLIKKFCSDKYNSTARRKLVKQLMQDEDLTEEEAEAEADAIIADPDRVWEYRHLYQKKDSYWEDRINSQFEKLIDDEIKRVKAEILASEEYLAKKETILTSDEFVAEYENTVKIRVQDDTIQELNNALVDLVTAYCDEMIAECNKALEEEINAFASKYAEATWKTYEDGVFAQLKKEFPTKKDDELKAMAKEMMGIIEDFAGKNASNTNYDNAINGWITKYFPSITEKDAVLKKYTELDKTFNEIYVPLYEDAYNKENLALYEIGYASKDILTVFKAEEEEEGTEGDGTTEGDGSTEGDGTTEGDGSTGEVPGEDDKAPGEFESYYEFVITEKFKKPYEAQFGTAS